MTSEIRTNSLKSRAGLSTVTLTDSGPMFSGITTFVDNSTFSVGTGGTIHAPAANTLNIGVNNTESLRIDSNSNLKVAGIVTATTFVGAFTGAASQVTATANNDNTAYRVPFTSAATGSASIYTDTNNGMTYNPSSGTLSATTFSGDGSNLTGITGTTINNNANNRIITGSGSANTLEGESSFTYNGNGGLDMEGTGAAFFQIKTPNTTDGGIYFRTGSTNAGAVSYLHTTNTTDKMSFRIGSTNKFIIHTSGFAELSGAADVRLTLGNAGTAGTNNANWIRGVNNNLYYNAATSDHLWEIGGAEHMRLDNSGNLFLRSESANYVVLGSSGDNTSGGITNNMNWIRGNQNNTQYNTAGGFHAWEVSGSEKVRITSDGRIGINATPSVNHEYLHMKPVGNNVLDLRYELNNNNDIRHKYYDDTGTWRGSFAYTTYTNSTPYPNFHDSFYWQTNPGSLRTVMRLNNQGILVQPYLPAFHWRKNNGQTYGTSFDTIEFGDKIFDRGNDIQGSDLVGSSTFTAPVTGIYFFHADVNVVAYSGKYFYLAFYKNGSQYSRTMFNYGQQRKNHEIAMIIDCSQGDQITARAKTNSGTITGDNDGKFFGYLIG